MKITHDDRCQQCQSLLLTLKLKTVAIRLSRLPRYDDVMYSCVPESIACVWLVMHQTETWPIIKMDKRAGSTSNLNMVIETVWIEGNLANSTHKLALSSIYDGNEQDQMTNAMSTPAHKSQSRSSTKVQAKQVNLSSIIADLNSC